jgi:DNA-directed RNA polymerase subunit RPC12/RpoP
MTLLTETILGSQELDMSAELSAVQEYGGEFSLRQTSVYFPQKHIECEVCGRMFARQQHKERHMLTHTGDKPFNCDICATSFADLATLRSHVQRHSDERPYKCAVCGEAFRIASGLRNHMATHSQVKVHTCELCLGVAHLPHEVTQRGQALPLRPL